MSSDRGFGAEFRRARRNADVTLFDVAALSGCSVAYISQVERGQKNPPKDSAIRAWLKAIDCEDRYEEFRSLARKSVKCFQVKTTGKSEAATEVMTLLGRSYESGDMPEEFWVDVAAFVEECIRSRKAR